MAAAPMPIVRGRARPWLAPAWGMTAPTMPSRAMVGEAHGSLRIADSGIATVLECELTGAPISRAVATPPAERSAVADVY